jgi:hypothetical protein
MVFELFAKRIIDHGPKSPITSKPCSACDKHRECASPANPIHGLGADSTTCVQSWLARQSLSELDELAKRLILTCW